MSKAVIDGLRQHLDRAYDEIKSLRIRISELEQELSSLRQNNLGEATEVVKGTVMIKSTKAGII